LSPETEIAFQISDAHDFKPALKYRKKIGGINKKRLTGLEAIKTWAERVFLEILVIGPQLNTGARIFYF
jgi:hypothetical protein